MVAFNRTLQTMIEKGQGTAARTLDRLPAFAQKSLVKILRYPHQYPELDPLIQCMMATQLRQGNSGFIGADVIRARKNFDLQMQSIKTKPTAVKRVEDLRLPLHSGTIFARHYHPAPSKKLPMVVFYHGGGFVVGSLDSHDEVCRLLAVHAKVQVMSIDYPLAPETSPIKLIQSCEDALAWVYQNRKQLKILKNRISVAGDSAGGNISAVVAQRSVNKVHAPQAQLLLYPALDFKSRHPSFHAYKEGLVLTGTDVDFVTQYYAETHQVELDDPIISPTYGEHEKSPPAFVITAGHDVLHDEGEIYAYKLRHRGVKVHYQEYTDQAHGFVNLTPISSRAKKYVIEISKNYRKFWDKHA
mgnify:FL=1